MAMVVTAVLIDDSDIDLFIQRRFLEALKFSEKLISYKSAEEALENLSHAAQPVPEVIFLDLNMPNVDGFGFLEGFKLLPDKIRDKPKIVVLTSSNSQQDRIQALAYDNVVHFVTKPLKQTDLEELKKILTPTGPATA